MSNTYSSVATVVQTTGIRKEDMGFATDVLMNQWIEARLIEIKDLIDQNRCRDYHKEVADGLREAVPPGIESIALRMMGNLIGFGIMRRTTPIIRVDDFTVKMVEEHIFTRGIRDDLKNYPRKIRIGVMVVSKDDD